MDSDLLKRAEAEAEESAPAPSVADCTPNGGGELAGRKASPLSAVAFRFLQVAESVVDFDETDKALFLAFCCLNGTKANRIALWRLARKPDELVNAFISWLDETPMGVAMRLAGEVAAGIAELGEIADIIGGDEDGGPEKNGTGSRS